MEFASIHTDLYVLLEFYTCMNSCKLLAQDTNGELLGQEYQLVVKLVNLLMYLCTYRYAIHDVHSYVIQVMNDKSQYCQIIH